MHLNENERLFIAGHTGMVGSAIWRRAEDLGFSNIIGKSSRDLDLRDRQAVFDFFEVHNPDAVILAAAKVGGIMANASKPVDFLTDNLRIQTNVMDAALASGVDRLVFMASSCIYPKFAPQPLKEEYLLTGPLESTNDSYSLAKLAGIQYVKSVRKQHGLKWLSILPTNLYGPGDKYSLHDSHVLPALLLKMHLGKITGQQSVKLWGDGTPLREFLHVEDLAEAVILAAKVYDDDAPINVGSGDEVEIRELARIIAGEVGYEGKVVWDNAFPNGTPRKLLLSDKIRHLGWSPKIPLREGIRETYFSAKESSAEFMAS